MGTAARGWVDSGWEESDASLMTLRFVEGDATRPIGDGTKILLHVCNDRGGWGAGFVVAISRRWKTPERKYREWYRSREGFSLGATQFVQVEDSLWVANVIGQEGYKPVNGVPPVRYDAIAKGLAATRDKARELNASVHMPRIGCGLAGGKWHEVEARIQSELVSHDIDVVVYDYKP